MLITLPKLGPVNFRDDLSPQEFDAQLQRLSQKYDFKIPKREMGLMEIAKQGAMRSLGETGIGITDTLPAMAASALGFNDYAKKQMVEAQEARAALQEKYPTRVASYKDISSPRETLEYGFETLGELLPSVGTALIPGVGLEAAGARLGASSAAKVAAERGLGEVAAKALVEKGAQSAGRIGQVGGLYLGSAAQNVPEVFEGIYRETGRLEPTIAALAGGISSVLDTALPAHILGNLGGYGKLKAIEAIARNTGAAPSVWKTIGKEAAKSALTEGLTETAQEGIAAYAEQVAGSTKGLFSPENMARYKESFVKGAIGGGAFGVPGGAAQGFAQKGEFNRQQAEQAAAQQAAAQPTPPPITEAAPAIPAPPPSTYLNDADKANPTSAAALAQMRKMVTDNPDISAQELVQAISEKHNIVPDIRFAQEAKLLGPETYLKGSEKNNPIVSSAITQMQGMLKDNPALTDVELVEAFKAASGHTVDVRYAKEAKLLGPIPETGVSNVAEPRSEPSGASVAVVDAARTGAPGSVATPKRDGVVPVEPNAGVADVGEAPKPAALKKKKETPSVPTPVETVQAETQKQTTTPAAATVVTEPKVEPAPAPVIKKPEPAPVPAPAPAPAPAVAKVEPKVEPKAEPKVEKPKAESKVEPKAEEPKYGASSKDLLAQKFEDDLNVVHEKLGKKGKLTEQENAAKSYFGKVVPELAIRSIANDLVHQNTPYRNAKMKAFEKSAEGPEPTFHTPEEAAFFKGQGGGKTKMAESWVRENLSPTSVKHLDDHIKLYEKEKAGSAAFSKKINKQQEIKAASEEQFKDENRAEGKTGEGTDVNENRAKKDAMMDIKLDLGNVQGKRAIKNQKKAAKKLMETRMGSEFLEMDEIADTDEVLLASPEVANMHDLPHPVVDAALRRGDLVGALQLLDESESSDYVSRVASTLAKYMGDTKIEYGAKESKFDPKTNTIYYRENPTEYEILHEATHAAVSHFLANPSHPVTKQLQALFDEIKGSIDGAYGAQNLQEFVAEVWSNKLFRQQLKEMPSATPKLSMWDKILNVFRRIFGFEPKAEPKAESVLDKTDALIDQIVGPAPEFRDGDTLYAQAINDPNIARRILQQVGTTGTVFTPERVTDWLASAETVGVKGRTTMYKFLNLSAFGQVSSRLLGREAIDFADKVNEMSGYYETLMNKLHPLHKRLEAYADPSNNRYKAWATLVHESSRFDVDPRKNVSEYATNPEKLTKYREFKAEYDRLQPNEKALYDDLFKAYDAMYLELKDSIRNNLMDAFPTDQGKALSAYNKIMDEITSKKIGHYVPLYRDGAFFLTYLPKGSAEHTTEMFNTQAEREAKRFQLEKDDAVEPNSFEEKALFDTLKARNIPAGTMAANIIKIMKDNGVDDVGIDKFIQLIVSAMPETSLMKSFQTRKGTPGYINDPALAFSNVSSSTARQLSRMRYSETLQGLVDKMSEKGRQMRGGDSTVAAEYVREFEARREYAMSPNVSTWARYASTGSFYFNLAFNVSSAFVNTLQTPMVVLPHLAGVHGWGNSRRALQKALNLYTSSGLKRKVTDINGKESEERAMLSIENLVNAGKNPEYKALIERLSALGFLQNSTARDALEASQRAPSESGGKRPLGERAAAASGFMMHHTERMNREITAVAAFDLEMERLKGKGITGDAAQKQAIEKAVRVTELTHGAGSAVSGPSIGHNDFGKVLTVFKRFGFTMYYNLFDNIRRAFPVTKDMSPTQVEEMQAARRQLAGIYGMAGLFAGVKGLPLFWVVQMAYDAFQDDDDDNFDTMMRKYLHEMVYKGPVNYLTNLGIADRVGWTDLIYRENKGGKADASALTSMLTNIAGAPYATADSIYRGSQLIGEGQFERGVEAMLPVALRNVLKGGRYAVEGVNTLRGDPVMGDINGYNAAMQVLGFAPADLLNQMEMNQYAKQLDDATVGKSKRLLKQYYIADKMGDTDRADAIREKLFALSDKHNLGVTDATINKSMKAREQLSGELYHGTKISKSIRDEVEQSLAEME